MAGIYIHIPYCHKACHYCNFHFSTSLKDIPLMVNAICLELSMRKDYLNNLPVETIYFGGGTPSVLSAELINVILNQVYSNYSVIENVEITLEANPEDISREKLINWKQSGINRLSIGIQSFQDDRLVWMNRNHTADDAVESVKEAQQAGFDNITIDLIYGLPGMTSAEWKQEIHTAIALDIPHISSYCLTIEEKTVFGHQFKNGQIAEIPEELSESHLLVLMKELEIAGYEQYEISNFCKKGFESIHNSNYWKRRMYLGVGPGAHSYNLSARHANISNNGLYIKEISNEKLPITTDFLTDIDHYNEYILTRIRTKWGISLPDILPWLPANISEIEKIINELTLNNFITKNGNAYLLTTKGKLLADEITLKLML